MPLNKDFEELIHLLNAAESKYMVVGAYAVIFYTEPRYTKDIDLWIKPDSENAEKVYRALKKFGAPLKDLAISDLTNPKMIYQIGIEPNRIDILMGLGKIAFEEVWKNRVTAHYGKEKIYLPRLKDLINAKKEAGRPKDRQDLQILLKALALKKTGKR